MYMLYFHDIMIPYPTVFLPTTECFIFGCLGRILEFQEDMKRTRADLYITTICHIGQLNKQ